MWQCVANKFHALQQLQHIHIGQIIALITTTGKVVITQCSEKPWLLLRHFQGTKNDIDTQLLISTTNMNEM